MNRRVYICRECSAPAERPMCYRCGKRLFEEMKRRLSVREDFRAVMDAAAKNLPEGPL